MTACKASSQKRPLGANRIHPPAKGMRCPGSRQQAFAAGALLRRGPGAESLRGVCRRSGAKRSPWPGRRARGSQGAPPPAAAASAQQPGGDGEPRRGQVVSDDGVAAGQCVIWGQRARLPQRLEPVPRPDP